MNKAIKVLTNRIEKLNQEYVRLEEYDDFEMAIEFEFVLNDMVNIQNEVSELANAIKILDEHNNIA